MDFSDMIIRMLLKLIHVPILIIDFQIHLILKETQPILIPHLY